MSIPSRTFRVVMWQRVMVVADIKASSIKEARATALQDYQPPKLDHEKDPNRYLGPKGVHRIWEV